MQRGELFISSFRCKHRGIHTAALCTSAWRQIGLFFSFLFFLSGSKHTSIVFTRRCRARRKAKDVQASSALDFFGQDYGRNRQVVVKSLNVGLPGSSACLHLGAVGDFGSDFWAQDPFHPISNHILQHGFELLLEG